MTKRKVFFRADAGVQIGYGHFIRSLALADILRDAFDCTFFSQSPSEYQRREAEMVCPIVPLPSDDRKFETFLNYLTGEEIVVLDNYFYTSEYQKQVKEKGCKLVCIDDMHDKHYYADLIINHGLTDVCLFDVEPYTRLCLGFEYALLRKPFLQQQDIIKEPDSWFISFGGTDYFNLTEKVLRAIHDDSRVKKIIVVIGDAYLYMDNLVKYTKASIKKNQTAMDMAIIMRKSQYAILPSSSVCIEALACGCNVAAGYFVDNQKPYHDEWSFNGYIVGLGNLLENPCNNVIDLLKKNIIKNSVSFSNIPSKYIQVFNEL